MSQSKNCNCSKEDNGDHFMSLSYLIKNLFCCGNCTHVDTIFSGNEVICNKHNSKTIPYGYCENHEFDGFNREERLSERQCEFIIEEEDD